ncbi:flagellar protein FlgN [Qipengyuania sp. DGS5-3]|uniref:flagellar protein FlgN n=1 Tax=Qipengyuania sp. DGS5-3 TaxID=3349632 RepID=UPI0036D3173F
MSVSTMAQSDALSSSVRQMIAVLETERQALAGLDLDGLIAASSDKQNLCDTLEGYADVELPTETRDLLETARRLNEVNRRVRNLLAANVAARLETLGAGKGTYQLAQASAM